MYSCRTPPVCLPHAGRAFECCVNGVHILRRRLIHVVDAWQVAEARSDETFVALCLLTVTGASLLTQKLGFSDTMGAFVAGVLLAETNYSTQASSPSSFHRIRDTCLHSIWYPTSACCKKNSEFEKVHRLPQSLCCQCGVRWRVLTGNTSEQLRRHRG